MKLSNPFAGVRNFIRSNESGRVYAHFPPAYERPSQPQAVQETHNLFLPLQDKSLLLRPLSDTHLLEVYQEAKAMRLSEEFISMIRQAIEQRGLHEPVEQMKE
ncbi:sporulation histidine kinase inhibitor Sda [Paenibacillus humicola]|uniref:sporulation histidine kinase inhibitor Sda n=1 Tax=Paenibacillus humicola TaxID=3110540 RepID=UPI00237B6E18|nr:sporulation histidine kinase inhibitor Sda [Paenibacillus humicola]